MELHSSTSPRADPRTTGVVSQAGEQPRNRSGDVNTQLSRESSNTNTTTPEVLEEKDAETPPLPEGDGIEKAVSVKSSRPHAGQGQYNYPNDIVDFDGPDDAENPKNFSNAKKWAITASMGWMTFVVTFSSSIFSVAVEPVSQEYGISRVVSTLGVSLFLLVRSLSSTSRCHHTQPASSRPLATVCPL